MIRLVGEMEVAACAACGGTGRKRFEDFQLASGKWARGGGFVPCPVCHGKKIVVGGGRREEVANRQSDGTDPTV